MIRPILRATAAGALLLVAAPAFAHTGAGEAHGFIHGFMHPVGGLDHVLAMVLVGMLAFQLGGHALWALPVAFVSVMALGGALGMAGIAVPTVEVGIALWVVVLGAALAFRLRVPVAVAAAVVGLFAVFHGYAHGAEMPESAGGLIYAHGFMLATALLHGCGLGLGYAIARLSDRHGGMISRLAGGLAGLAGVGLLVGNL